MTEAGERLKSGRLARLCRGGEGERWKKKARVSKGGGGGGCKRWSERVDEPGSEVG